MTYGRYHVKHRKLCSVLCDDVEKCNGEAGGRSEVQEGGEIHIYTVDSLHFTTETNTTL